MSFFLLGMAMWRKCWGSTLLQDCPHWKST